MFIIKMCHTGSHIPILGMAMLIHAEPKLSDSIMQCNIITFGSPGRRERTQTQYETGRLVQFSDLLQPTETSLQAGVDRYVQVLVDKLTCKRILIQVLEQSKCQGRKGNRQLE